MSVVSDSVWPQRWQPTRLPRPWDSPGKNNGVGCHFPLQCMKVKSESEVTQSRLTLSDPWTAAHQAPLSTGFSREEYWSGVSLHSPILQASRTQFECLLNLWLPGCSTSKLQINIPVYFNQSLFQKFWFIDMAEHLLKLMAVTKTHFTEAQWISRMNINKQKTIQAYYI